MFVETIYKPMTIQIGKCFTSYYVYWATGQYVIPYKFDPRTDFYSYKVQ